MQFIRYLSQKSLHLLYLGCFTIFIVQMSFLIYSRVHPSQTISSTKQRQLEEIDFPVAFKICIKPAYDVLELNRAGYFSAWDYFVGCSKYNGFLMGWAGHTQDGKAVSNVSGSTYSTSRRSALHLFRIHLVSFACRYPRAGCDGCPQSSEGCVPLPEN